MPTLPLAIFALNATALDVLHRLMLGQPLTDNTPLEDHKIRESARRAATDVLKVMARTLGKALQSANDLVNADAHVALAPEPTTELSDAIPSSDAPIDDEPTIADGALKTVSSPTPCESEPLQSAPQHNAEPLSLPVSRPRPPASHSSNSADSSSNHTTRPARSKAPDFVGCRSR